MPLLFSVGQHRVLVEGQFVEPRRVEPRRVEPRRVGAQNFALFFPLSRHKIRSFLPSLGVFSWNFGGV